MATTRTEVEALISTNLASGGTPLITASNHREVENAIVDFSANVFKMTGSAGTTITNAAMEGRDIGLIIMNSIAINIGFSKPLSGTTITFTDGTTLIGGETITIILI